MAAAFLAQLHVHGRGVRNHRLGVTFEPCGRDHRTRRNPLHERAVSGSITGMERSRRTARWTNVVLACGAFVLCLAALDRLVAWTDLGYRAARYRPNEDRRLTLAVFDVHVVTNALAFRDARMPGPKPARVQRVVV